MIAQRLWKRRGVEHAAVMALALFSSLAVGGEVPAPKMSPVFHALPENTLLAVAFTDLDRWRSDLKNTAFYELWMDANLQPFREQGWPKIKKAVAEKTGISLDEVDGLIHGDILFVLALSQSPASGGQKPNEPQVRPALLIRPSTNRAQVESFVKTMLGKIPEGTGPVQRWESGILILADTESFAGEIATHLHAGRSPLAGSAAFAAFQKDCNPRGFFHAWVNLERLIAWACETTPDAQRARQMFDTLGLGGLNSLCLSSVVEGKGFLTTVRLRSEEPRSGILEWMGDHAPSKGVRLVPADASGYVSLRMAGLDKILASLRSMLIATGAVSEPDWQEAMAGVREAVALDLEKDLPRMIGHEIVFYSGGEPALIPQIQILVESPDPPLLLRTLDRLLAANNIQATTASASGLPYKYFMIPEGPMPFQIAYGRVGDFVLVATQQSGFIQTAQVYKSGRSLAAHPEYSQAMKHVGPAGWAESYTKTAKEIVALSVMMLPMMLSEINEQLGTDFTSADLPNLQVLLNYEKPCVSRVRSLPDGLEVQSYAEGGISLSMPAAAGIMAAVAIPAFIRGREAARATACQSNLLQLQLAVNCWAVDYNKHDGDTVTLKELVGPNLYLKQIPRCPAGGSYGEVFTVGKAPTCDYTPPAWFDTQGDKYLHKIPEAK
ncbi:MAG: hypothetical protein N3D11_12710 [Candidatus Sumerlaeia bacterium]|nr:hypothetical protein [Candidatus Sumerlaeia bacterium]